MPDAHHHPPFPGSRLPHVGTYRRTLPVSLERLYENALDWAHLPHVHGDDFSRIELEDAGAWGWRARTADRRGRSFLLELRLDRDCRRWITRTLDGTNSGSEIWTHAFCVERRRTDIVVDFFVPDAPAEDRGHLGRVFGALYERLYDQDVAMMTERQRQLDQRIEARRETSRCLGATGELSVPITTEFDGRSYLIVEVDGNLRAHAARCPHQLGPLQAAVDGVTRCPWHGYRFDVRSGDCLTGQPCRLPPAPDVRVRDGMLWLERRV
jgi:nitrite reductase/ring-hydroxylating ferredoxin subunit